MSLRINHNITALDAHRNLVNSTSMLSKSMEKLSSGFRINKAADNPAGLVISEQFRAQIAGLNRAIDNSEGSINMIQTAEGALTEINNLLVSMRELAIHAANEGFNDSNQLAADQAEIENAIKTIDRIAVNTQFGTKKLLDGSKDNIATFTSANSTGFSILQSTMKSGSHSVSATKTSDSTATLNTTSLGMALNGNGTPTNLEEKVHNIDILQSSDIAKKSSDGFSIADAFGNNLTLAATATVASVGTAGTLNATVTAAHVGTYQIVLNYQENGESTTGNQTLSVDLVLADTQAGVATKINNAIASNTFLAGKVTAAVTGNRLHLTTANQGGQHSLKYVSQTITGATTNYFSLGSARSHRGSSDNQLNFTVTTASQASTTSSITLTAGAYASHAAMVTEINTQLSTTFGKVKNDNAVSDLVSSVANTNQIQIATRDEGSAYSIKLNDLAGGTGDLHNVLKFSVDTVAKTGSDALVAFDNYTNTVTSVQYKYGASETSDEVTLRNGASGAANTGTLKMLLTNASSGGVNTGNLLVDVKAARFDVRLDGGPATAVTAGKESVIFNASRDQSVKMKLALTSTGGTETINDIDQSLVFQIGGSVGQTATIGLRNMSASSLGKNIAANMFASLSKIDVTTVQGATDTQSIIDQAINEVSSARGTLGSFQKNTLESNLRNLRIAAQNLEASESNIRDTDMAREMTEFTKAQILSQAGTAMLAQANQIPQTVLSLFR